MKILFCAYRGWAFEVFTRLATDRHSFELCINPASLDEQVKTFQPDVVLCCGWSWIIPPELLALSTFVGMHPSPLPEYAGGTPIQHQILDGLTSSVASLFEITPSLDAGGVIDREPYSLEGNMRDVLDSLSEASCRVFARFIDKFPNYVVVPQSELGEGFHRRRIKPEASRLTPELMESMTARELYNFIRCREDPYPNAYIQDHTGRLYFKLVKFE